MKRLLLIILKTTFFLLLFSLIFEFSVPVYAESLKKWNVRTPAEALAIYFPSPPLVRCLNHSNIPKVPRKAVVNKKIKFSNKKEIEQNITIGIQSISEKKFVITGNVITNEKIVPLEIDLGPAFDIKGGQKVKPSFLFGLEDLIGLQRKIYIMDVVGDQIFDYETYLKTTRGMIGDLNYDLELIGRDKSVNGEIKYFLNGGGTIGQDEITVEGTEPKKDYYELTEKYGNVVVFTTLRVYD